MLVAGEPLVVHALRRAIAGVDLGYVVTVAPQGHVDTFISIVEPVLSEAGLDGVVVAGGRERQDSVRIGLDALPAAIETVLIHDAARALAPSSLFGHVVAAVMERGTGPANADPSGAAFGVVPGLPVVDTLKSVGADGLVTGTPDRASLRAVQTPQGFPRAALVAAHARAVTEGWTAVTDDAGLIERLGGRVWVVPGEARATKVTVEADLGRLEQWLAESVAPSPSAGPLLLVLSGPPYSGKSTLARSLAQTRRATHVRIDALEEGLRQASGRAAVGVLGYAAGMALAREQLLLGLPVVADAVNPVPESRAAWVDLAADTGARLVQVELIISGVDERSRRAAVRDVQGHPVPAADRAAGLDYQPWREGRDGQRHQIETTHLSPEQVVAEVQRLLGEPEASVSREAEHE